MNLKTFMFDSIMTLRNKENTIFTNLMLDAICSKTSLRYYVHFITQQCQVLCGAPLTYLLVKPRTANVHCILLQTPFS